MLYLRKPLIFVWSVLELGKPKNRFRHWFQAAWFALTNGYAKGFLDGKIYTGDTKSFCVPGLNCYSCPGALGSCPIGSLQAVLGSKDFKISCYVFGLLMAFGAFFGRLICGWLCPFGLVQDLLYKIPLFQKIKKLPGDRFLKWIKYVMLAVFVILLPSLIVDVTGTGKPWFCEYICPSGTLLGGIPLVIMNQGLQQAAGYRFAWKVFLLLVILVLSVKSYRPFCRYLCPLGAFYGLLNPVSFYRFKINEDTCVKCGVCQKTCKMDIKVWENPNSMDCIRCGDCKAACPKKAITSTWEEAEAKMILPTPTQKIERKAGGMTALGVIVIVCSCLITLYSYFMFSNCILGVILEPSTRAYIEIIVWLIMTSAGVISFISGVLTIVFSKDASKQKTQEHLWYIVLAVGLFSTLVYLFFTQWGLSIFILIYFILLLILMLPWKIGLILAKRNLSQSIKE
ncbi:MAG: 4Fe-4S binding protein [Clostridia bacterium]|nr:4Fe-4S binding protein [Clostridia bacterium]